MEKTWSSKVNLCRIISASGNQVIYLVRINFQNFARHFITFSDLVLGCGSQDQHRAKPAGFIFLQIWHRKSLQSHVLGIFFVLSHVFFSLFWKHSSVLEILHFLFLLSCKFFSCSWESFFFSFLCFFFSSSVSFHFSCSESFLSCADFTIFWPS